MNLKDKTVVIDSKTYRYSKIVMLETEDRSNIFLNKRTEKLNYFLKGNNPNNANHQHLYFLSTDKIYEGDWFIYKETFLDGTVKTKEQFNNAKWVIKQCEKNEYSYIDRAINGKNSQNGLLGIFKIISSTDLSLNLPKPSDSFLQVYIDAYNKGEKIEECLVEYEEENVPICSSNVCETIKTFKSTKLKTTKGEITIRKVKDSWNREEIVDFTNKLRYFINEKQRSIAEVNDWISENL